MRPTAMAEATTAVRLAWPKPAPPLPELKTEICVIRYRLPLRDDHSVPVERPVAQGWLSPTLAARWGPIHSLSTGQPTGVGGRNVG
jgi:hypothetical protein